MTAVDDLVASALCGPASWPAALDGNRVVERAIYHGVTGLLMARVAHLVDWPEDVRNRLRAEALGRTMWEIRHRTVLVPLLAALDAAGVGSVLLKGTALAYGLYPEPAQRTRGDTDLLVAPDDLDRARDALVKLGFGCTMPMVADAAAPERQESWTFIASDGGLHEIDLHVDVFSSPALKPVLEGAEALAGATPLPALSPVARALPLPLALLQACLHRAQHVVSPYSVAGQWHYGGDRLIWLVDIDLALRAMTRADHDRFQQAALSAGVGPICAAALRSAVALLQTPCAEDMIEALENAPRGPAARYLSQSRSLGRVMSDLHAIPGLKGKLQHAGLRLFPPASTLRASYPDLEDAALPRLHLRRISGLFRYRKADRT